jgi:superfamily II DNA/RNA helicase
MEIMEYADDISSIRFNQLTIGDSTCNINRKLDKDIFLLHDFADALPYYDEINKVHLNLSSDKTKGNTVVKLNDYVCNRILIKNSREMDDNEYYKKFTDKKTEFVKNCLIKKTFAKGYDIPSPVQSITIPELILGKDVLVQFKSGTGKTWAFLFGLLWSFDLSDKELQHIFIANSHEVAMQIFDQACFILPETTKIVLCVGQKRNTGGFRTPIGTSGLTIRHKTLKEEREEIEYAQVIVCTIGKFYDVLCNKRWIRTTDFLKAICVDEFDNIVASKFRQRSSHVMSTEEQMATIIRKIPPDAQRAFFSATVTKEALEIAHSYFRKYSPSIGEPLIVLLDVEDYTLDGIYQYYVECHSTSYKKDVLLDLLKQCRIAQGIVFTNKIDTAIDIKRFLDEQVVPVSSDVFHGNLPEETRKLIHRKFMENKIRLLISTDLTSRGLDIQGINVVINFDMPDSLETYIHRIGRSGRYGRKGVAISLILVNSSRDERKKVETINECSKHNKMEPLPADLANLL